MKVTGFAVFLCVFYLQNLAFFSSVYFKSNNILKIPRRSTAAGLGKHGSRKILMKDGMFP